MRSFFPASLSIKARHIEQWVDKQMESRSLFPVLLRKLIHTTGEGLSKVDFPGYDDAQRKGSDGIVISDSSTSWIPEGDSYWEFGTNQNPGSKANSDYRARIESINIDIRTKSSFVFVTPRRWNGKTEWVKEMNKTGDWKMVYAFDSSDLEQWIEQSPLTQVWLAEQMEMELKGFETLNHAWYRWSNATEPVLSDKIFTTPILTYKQKVKDWLSSLPEEPFTVVADSRDEALAFLSCLFNEAEFEGYKDFTAVFTSEHKLRELLSSSAKFISIINSEDAEREFLNAHNRHHCIIIRTRNMVDNDADILLDLLSRETITEALTEMGFERDRIERLISESGKSATILRRRLSKNPAIKKPLWARNDNLTKSLIPVVLVGVWNAESENDWEIVSEVADKKPSEIETTIMELLALEDSPVWSEGKYRGIISQMDTLFVVARMMTSHELKKFFKVAKRILSEEDPALELPEEDRWAAAIYHKTFNYSGVLRKSICETLVILSVYGNELFQKRIGVDIEEEVAAVIHHLLEPLTLDKLISHNKNLPYYAEASPNVFLHLIEKDLKTEDPVVFSLIKPTSSGILEVSPPRTGFLWALECLAWKPQSFSCAVKVLAKLSQFEIDDNWENKPFNSLKAIFRSWMPQTAVAVEPRVQVLKRLKDTFPDIWWKLSIIQLKQENRFGSANYRPKWRDDALGVGEVVTIGEIQDFINKILKFLIEWDEHNEETLGELVEILHLIPEDYRKDIWNLIIVWSETANDFSKSVLREQIRHFILTSNSVHQNSEEIFIRTAREVYEKLKPADIVIRHRWLYLTDWLQPFIEDEEELELIETRGTIDELRCNAITEIWDKRGFLGIEELVSYSGAANIVGRYIAKSIENLEELISFTLNSLSITGDLEIKFNFCLQEFLSELDSHSFQSLLGRLTGELNEEKQKRFLKCLPFSSSVWRHLDEFSESARVEYWTNVHVYSVHERSEDLIYISDNLLKVGRPSAALYAINHNLNKVESSYIEGILRSIAVNNSVLINNSNIENHLITKALNFLNENGSISDENLSNLEFLYVNKLNNTSYKFPGVEHLNFNSPSLFMQLITLGYRRNDQREDPKEWTLENPEQQRIIGMLALNLLNELKTTPGTDEKNRVNPQKLREWIKEARQKSLDLGREDVTDLCIGELLSKSPRDKEGIWPQRGVCMVLEEISSQKIAKGIRIGILNSRGVIWRGPDGEQERQMAAMYRGWAEKFHFEFPYVGNILEDVARTYEKEAIYYDVNEEITKRLLE